MSILTELWDSLIVKALATLLAPFVAAAIYFLGRRTWLAFRALRLVDAALAAVARKQVDGVWTEGDGFWLKRPIVRPAKYGDLKGSSIPILMIAATKGGVGKTTLAGSLAAHFALRWTQRRQDPNVDLPLRVLVIDQDFQGSFTTMTVSINFRFAQPSKANQLVSGELGQGRLVQVAELISQPGMVDGLSIRTIPAYYDLAQAENRMLVHWLLPLSDERFVTRLLRLLKIRDKNPENANKDIRYLLAEALLDPLVQASFDLVIIDSPPRLTTSHVQGMCAATHLLVPTILDGLAGDAVARYLDQVAILKFGPKGDESRAICPHLQPIGVVCTLVPNTVANLEGPINVLRQRIVAAQLRPDIVPEQCFIRQRPPYREHAGERIAYAAESENDDHRKLRKEVDSLGDWVASKLGAETKGWKRRLDSNA